MISGRKSYVLCTHDVIDDVTRSKRMSHFEIGISPSIFQLVSIKSSTYWKHPWLSSRHIQLFMVMTSLMTSHGVLKIGPLYSFINGIRTCFMITKKREEISSSNTLYISTVWLCLYLNKLVFMTSLGLKINLNFNCRISGNISAIASIKYSKCRKWSWLWCWHI